MDKTFRLDLDGKETLDFDKLALLAFRLDKVVESLPEIDFPPTEANMEALVMTLLTRYELEGFGAIKEIPEVEFGFFNKSIDANNKVGETDCATYVLINERVTIPIDPRFGQGWVVGTAHELAHWATGEEACRTADPALRETTAQIGAIEVCAGLALEGSLFFFGEVVRELRRMTMSAAFGTALIEGQLERYERLRRLLSPGAITEAAFQRMLRLAENNYPPELVKAYWVTPMQMIVDSAIKAEPAIEGLAFPPRMFTNTNGMFLRNPYPDRRYLDDTKYLFEHLEELAGDIATKA